MRPHLPNEYPVLFPAKIVQGRKPDPSPNPDPLPNRGATSTVR